MSRTKPPSPTPRLRAAKRPSGIARAHQLAKRVEEARAQQVEAEDNTLKAEFDQHHPELYGIYRSLARNRSDKRRDLVSCHHKLGLSVQTLHLNSTAWRRLGTALGVSERNLVLIRRLLKVYPTVGDLALVLSRSNGSGQPLCWGHFRLLLSHDLDTNRKFMINRILQGDWTPRQLAHQITRMYGRRRSDGHRLVMPATLDEAITRWVQMYDTWIRCNKEIFNADLLTALSEADPNLAVQDPSLFKLQDQIAWLLTDLRNQLQVVGDLRKESRARMSTQGLASQPLKLAQIDEDEVRRGDS